jgi:hypothetical protein
MIQIHLTSKFRGIIPLLAAALLAGCTPLYLSDTHTTSTPRPQFFDVTELAREPVATLGLLTPAGLQGFNPPLSHALNAALSEASPPIRGIAAQESAGEVTVATKLLRSEQTVPLDEIAQKLWLRMIRDNLLEEKTGSRLLFSN